MCRAMGNHIRMAAAVSDTCVMNHFYSATLPNIDTFRNFPPYVHINSTLSKETNT